MSTIPSLTIVANKQTALAERHRGTYEQAGYNNNGDLTGPKTEP